MDYISWPQTLADNNKYALIHYSEGRVVAMIPSKSLTVGAMAYFYRIYIDGKLVDGVHLDAKAYDFLLREDRIFIAMLNPAKIVIKHIGQRTIVGMSTVPIPLPAVQIISFTMYRCNPAAVITTAFGYYIMVFHGLSTNYVLDLIKVNGNPQRKIKKTRNVAIGITGVPNQLACFACITPYQISIFNSVGPYDYFVSTDTEKMQLQSPLWFTTNHNRHQRAHMSYNGWNLVAHIESGIVRLKYSFDETPKTPTEPWITIFVDGVEVGMDDLIEIPSAPYQEYEVRLRAEKLITDVDVQAMQGLHAQNNVNRTSYVSKTLIPYLAQGDEYVFNFKPVTKLPGYLAASIFEKLNILARAEIW